MKVILLENVDNVGLPGQITDVKNGFYRNYLSPRGLAVEATEGNLNGLKEKRRKLEHAAEQIVDEAKGVGDRLEGVELTFAERVGANNRLYGSVTTHDIAQALAEQGFEIDRRKIALPEQIKTTGTFTAQVKLHAELAVQVKIIVENEAPGEEESASETAQADPEAEPTEAEAETAAEDTETEKSDGEPDAAE